MKRVIVDTNVILSGLKSAKGSSFKLLSLIPENRFEILLSVPLVMEYEAVLLKHLKLLGLSKNDIDDFIDYLCKISIHHKIYYLWRPFLKDPYDDHILELAVAASADFIITFNIKDFDGTEKFGIRVIEPDEFLNIIGEKI
ncbi:MAG TPA: putative toxin-antitoxin system toxin component, PIN family [Spirochaetota bacterium]|jgi:putative PIN family toxin of toxin-antitoxin system|nr:putative toxin-antitoxin system toxin component, PIN family [Spirochaetota bacterium]HPJ16463.1 putative toxin-antitoxin system toxin component, PIN family [Spirochaetota bacterium]HPM35741.1 putative toxin-antitoxin system toxin component, PIN family [Spirochaetota bacterium]HPY03126.1 putative toxin-antitoxin system toxin component, PIN family [Spirochaetota bacterium]HQA52665.1 putative toxin-antitoxin system toxin component, PIN family [Spirochaetota bacterium]